MPNSCARGAWIIVPPADRAYGMRDFNVLDPDGNTLVFGMSLAGRQMSAGGYMARDIGLEDLIRADLPAGLEISEKSMFSGWAWLVDGVSPSARAATACSRGSARATTPGR